jgi:O-antigen/teichoic acid export membrane protein
MPLETFRRLKYCYAPEGSFSAHVLTLMTGTTIAQAVPLALSPILSRIYAPSEFGVFALFSSLVSMAAIIATGRYEMAIMLPENDEDAVNLLVLSIFISSIISLICLAIVWILNSQITALLGNQSISKWLYWVPFSVLLTGVYQSFNYWSTRKKQYKRLAISRISQSSSTSSTNLLMGVGGFGVSGLILGNVFGQGVATGILAWQVWKEDKCKTIHISKEVISANAIKYRDFPIINSIHAFMDVMQTSGVVFVISAFFGSVALGFYSFTLRVTKMPLNLIASSVAQVFYQKASEVYSNSGDLHQLIKKTVIKLGLIAVPMFLINICFAPIIFSFIFGKNWEVAGKYSQILSPWLFINFIVSPISQIPIIVNMQKTGFAIGIVYSVSIFAPLFIASYMKKDIIVGLYSSSICASLVLIYYVYWIYKISNKRMSNSCHDA